MIPIFPKANYEDCDRLQPHKQFKKIWKHPDEDLHNEMVFKSIRQNRFQLILQFLHFKDISKAPINGNKMWKLRPITDYLKANMLKHFHPQQNLSDSIHRHRCKQFIKGKPLRFGC